MLYQKYFYDIPSSHKNKKALSLRLFYFYVMMVYHKNIFDIT